MMHPVAYYLYIFYLIIHSQITPHMDEYDCIFIILLCFGIIIIWLYDLLINFMFDFEGHSVAAWAQTHPFMTVCSKTIS